MSIWLTDPRRSTAIIVGLLSVHAVLLAALAWQQSPCRDETLNLPAGLSHWELGDFHLYRVNPPLTRVIAAIPVWHAGGETDWRSYAHGPGVRTELAVAHDFLDRNQARSIGYFRLARLTMIGWTVLAGWVCWRWASQWHGVAAGYVACALWCFSPNILGEGCLLGPDVAAGSVAAWSGYRWWRWGRSREGSDALVAGVSLGLALVTKLTWLPLLLIYPGIAIGMLVTDHLRASRRDRAQASPSDRRLRGWHVMLAIVAALFVVNACYMLQGSFQPLKRYEFVSRALGGTLGAPGNRFAGTWLGNVPVPLPDDYVLGLDQAKADLEQIPFWSYLGGEHRYGGWYHFYLYCLVVKLPIGTWVLLGLATISGFRRAGTDPAGAPHRATIDRIWEGALLLTPPLWLLAILSSQIAFSQHLRYLLPAYPFGYIFAARTAAGIGRVRPVWSALLVGCVSWSCVSGVWFFPDCRAYFNELAGGPANGHRHLLYSGLDDGQDLLRLQAWLVRHPEVQDLQLAYFGAVNPRLAGIEFRLPPRHPEAPERPETRQPMPPPALPPGWYAASVNAVYGYRFGEVIGPDGQMIGLEPQPFSYFRHLRPTARVGYTIYLYHVK